MRIFKREKYLRRIRGFYKSDDIIKVITGVRRCGKSTLMQMIASEIKASGVKEENLIFLDLDKKEYRKIRTADQLEQLIDNACANKRGRKYLFIDEIQNVKDFEELINAYRNDGGYSIFITGSNSYLLSGELATKLTGRYMEFEMMPLSFDEYLQMKAFYGKPVSASLDAELRSYILESGFPRTIFLDSMQDKRAYLTALVNEIFEKDIRRRLKIRNMEAFEKVRHFIINNFGAMTSIKKLASLLRSDGLTISRATTAAYLQALKNAKIIYECPRFDMKSKKSLSGEKKYYLSDLGFYYAANTDNRINYGPVLENIIFAYAKSLDYSISIGRIGSLECDFILRNSEMDYIYVQSSYTILASRETEDREYRPLESVRDNYRKYVFTTDTLLQKRNGIIHANLLEFIRDGKAF